MAASRLQRQAIISASYWYTIEYAPTKKHENADCLSRLTIGNDPIFKRYQSKYSVVNMVQESPLTSLQISAEEVRKATEDHVLQKVIKLMKTNGQN